MPFWGLEDWRRAGETMPVVSDFEPEQFADGCYRLALGREAIVSVEANATSGVRRNLAEDESLQILPGQFAYLITSERVRIPDAAIGLINVATKIKLAGIVNISGFHVDPGYDGRLIFTVFNAGAQAVHLGYRERIFRLWLDDYRGVVKQKENGYDTIPHEWANGLVGAYPSPFVVDQRVREIKDALESRVSTLETEIREVKSDKHKIFIGLFIISLLLLPFVASLYAGLYQTIFQSSVGPIPTSGIAWIRSWLTR